MMKHSGLVGHFAALAIFALSACGSSPQNPDGGALPPLGQGTVAGMVLLGSPVRGAVVTAYAVDAMTGVRLAELARSEPTNEYGQFTLQIKERPAAMSGPVVLVASGEGATYLELTTGNAQAWSKETSLRAAYRDDSQPSSQAFLFYNQAIPGVVIGPWSELAYAYAEARRGLGRSSDFPSALERSYALFQEHLEHTFDRAVPQDISAAASPSANGSGPSDAAVAPVPSEQVKAALLLVGLSSFVERAHTPGVSAASLVAWLREDLADDALFNGRNNTFDPIKLSSTCQGICEFSGATLRRELANSIARYLNSPANRTGIATASVHDLLSRISTRQSDLFASADGAKDFDSAGPAITVVDSPTRDEAGLTWALAGTMAEPPEGQARIPQVVQQGSPRTVVLKETSQQAQPDFTRNATNYVFTGGQAFDEVPGTLPVWKFDIRDDEQTNPPQVRARIFNGNGVLVDWFNVATKKPGGLRVNGERHEIYLSTDLHPSIGEVSGNFRLEIEALDDLLNATRKQVYWHQTVTPPPIRVVPTYCNPCQDKACPAYYSLGGFWWHQAQCKSIRANTNNFSALLDGKDIPNQEVMAVSLRVDNPSSVPVRVLIDQRGVLLNFRSVLLQNRCGDAVPPSECFKQTSRSQIRFDFNKDPAIGIPVNPPRITLYEENPDAPYAWDKPVQRVPCNTCATNEFIIPPRHFVGVAYYSSSWGQVLGNAIAGAGPLGSNNEFLGRRVSESASSFLVEGYGAVKAQTEARLLVTTRTDNSSASSVPAEGPPSTHPALKGFNRKTFGEISWHWNWMDTLAKSFFEENRCAGEGPNRPMIPELCGWPWQWDPWLFAVPTFP